MDSYCYICSIVIKVHSSNLIFDAGAILRISSKMKIVSVYAHFYDEYLHIQVTFEGNRKVLVKLYIYLLQTVSHIIM